jgi:hypothetical protein
VEKGRTLGHTLHVSKSRGTQEVTGGPSPALIRRAQWHVEVAAIVVTAMGTIVPVFVSGGGGWHVLGTNKDMTSRCDSHLVGKPTKS